MHPYTHILKTTGYIWIFHILNNCSTNRDVYLLCWSCCEIKLASYGSKHAFQSLSDKQFVCTYMPSMKSTGHIWMFCILNDCSTIRTGELEPQLCINFIKIKLCVGMMQASTCITIWYANTYHETPCMTRILHTKWQLYCQPVLFIRTKLVSYTTHCRVFPINRVH